MIFMADDGDELELVATDRRPDEAPGVVVHDDRQVAVPALIADLVDPNTREPVEGVTGRAPVRDDASDDRAYGPPGDAHELAHRRLRGVGDEPGHCVVEVAGVTRAVTRPRHRGETFGFGLDEMQWLTLNAMKSSFAPFDVASALQRAT